MQIFWTKSTFMMQRDRSLTRRSLFIFEYLMKFTPNKKFAFKQNITINQDFHPTCGGISTACAG
ncbi:hypothetical protein [Nostoc sp. NMS9]|uniref:hypothetical protein n=1 Tax=Nostoc sp. NMS9 TaxID=2815393 RepID=UPI0025F00633|nr:hypothetical protein [Nostoc sp. NMS9]